MERVDNCSEEQQNRVFPPWSSDPETFQTLCTGCAACVSSCAEELIISGENKLPIMDFSKGPCTFCGDCARSCTIGALSFSPNTPPWQLRVVVQQDCLLEKKVLCQLCQEQCEQEAIVFARGGQDDLLPQILPEQCNGCGACVAGCPVQAISLQYIENQSFKQSLNQSLPRGDA